MEHLAGLEREIGEFAITGIAANDEANKGSTNDAGHTRACTADHTAGNGSDSHVHEISKFAFRRRSGKGGRDPRRYTTAVGKLNLTKYETNAPFACLRCRLDCFDASIQTASLRYDDVAGRTNRLGHDGNDRVAGI